MTPAPGESQFAGRTVAVTGGASGIGLGVASRLAELGADVFSLDLQAGPVGTHVETDVRDPESLRAAAQRVVDEGDGVDGLVVSAGVRGPDQPAEELPIEAFDDVLAVNLRGVFATCQAFGRHMLAAGAGRIVVLASMSGNRVINVPMKISHYHAAKGGVVALVRALGVEWGPRGVLVNALSPGYIRTPLSEADPQHHDLWRELTVLGRLGEVDEVAAGVLFLLSDEAGFCCGTDLLMDGGYTLR